MSEELPQDAQGSMIVFGAKTIRRKWVDEQWYFSVVDILAALTDSENPRDDWYRMKQREAGIESNRVVDTLSTTETNFRRRQGLQDRLR